MASSAVAELIQILAAEPDVNQRRAAAETLGNIGKEAAAAVPALIDTLRDEDEHVRYHCVVALGMIGPAASHAIPALKQMRQDSYREVHWAAVVSLRKIGPFPIAEVIAELKTNSSWVIRSDAAKMLGETGKEAQAAIPVLIDALNDKDHSVRSNAAMALGLMGSAAKDAVPALQGILEDPRTKKAASKAIEQIRKTPG
jgi:HEAT repeat protein